MDKPPPIRPEEIVRGVAHDLVNPLSSVSGFLKLLLDPAAKDPLTHRQARMLGSMDRACTHIVGLLGDLSALCALESGEGAGARAPVDLRAAVRKAFDDHALLAARRRIHLVLDAAADVPAVPGDAGLVERFFDALLRAAGRLTPDGGRIRLTLEKTPSAVEGTLEHDGESLPPATWDRLFAGALSAPRPPEGYAALGPALCRRIAALHGGGLEARARDGGGTRFAFRFSLRPLP